MSTELITIDNNVPAPIVDTGLGDLTRIRPTSLSLVQPVTREAMDAQPGEFLDAITGQGHKEMDIVPLRVWRSRVLFPPTDDETDFSKQKSLCFSSDGKMPHPSVETPQALSCANCPKGKWMNTPTGGVRPECDEKWKMLLVERDTGAPKILTIGGVSIKAARAFLENVNYNILVAKNKFKIKLELFDFCCTLRSEKVIGKKGVYYVIKFDSVKRLENPGTWGAAFEEFVVQRRIEAEEEAAMTEQYQEQQSTDGVIDAEIVEA